MKEFVLFNVCIVIVFLVPPVFVFRMNGAEKIVTIYYVLVVPFLVFMLVSDYRKFKRGEW